MKRCSFLLFFLFLFSLHSLFSNDNSGTQGTDEIDKTKKNRSKMETSVEKPVSDYKFDLSAKTTFEFKLVDYENASDKIDVSVAKNTPEIEEELSAFLRIKIRIKIYIWIFLMRYNYELTIKI